MSNAKSTPIFIVATLVRILAGIHLSSHLLSIQGRPDEDMSETSEMFVTKLRSLLGMQCQA
jgi:hypothetical protein